MTDKLLHGKLNYDFFGPFGAFSDLSGFVIVTDLLFLMSFLVEYYIVRSILQELVSVVKKLKTIVLTANISSYLVPTFLPVV